MDRWHLKALGIVVGLAVAMPLVALAQGGAGSPGRPGQIPDVVVTGERMSDEQARVAISRFVSAHTTYTVTKQIARWRVPVCPAVVGLPKEYGTFIANRIKTLARSVRARVEEPCKPNVTIIFTQRPQTVLDEIAKNRPVLLGFHFVSQRKALATVRRPIQAWYVTATRSILSAAPAGNSDGTATIDSAYHPRPAGKPGSRLSNDLSSELAHVLVVANSDVTGGMPVGAVADYIAMITLSQVAAPDDCTQLRTILSYLSECPAGRKADSLTAADRAYLEGLYSISPEAFGTLQRSGIVTHMNRGLTEPAPPAEPEADAQAQ
jgi:hypothetical protein